MKNLYLFATIADTPVAVRSSEIEGVVRIGHVTPVPAVPAHVKGLTTLRSRVLTVLDVARLVEPRQAIQQERNHAIVCEVSGHSYGLLVDKIIDICQVEKNICPLGGLTKSTWKRYSEGSIQNEGQDFLLVSLSHFIDNNSMPQNA
jgi:purine-binding chemotaxis protein CheW